LLYTQNQPELIPIVKSQLAGGTSGSISLVEQARAFGQRKGYKTETQKEQMRQRPAEQNSTMN
jgi:hypothetical protein